MEIDYLGGMEKYSQRLQIRWADIDANRHLRHSVYYDFGATLRMSVLSELGLSVRKLEEIMVGPILFREEGIFRREIVFEDTITLDVELFKATPDYSRWSLRHNFIKDDGTLAATVTVDGAWIDMVKRKLTVPNIFIHDVFEKFPKAADFQFFMPEKKISTANDQNG